MLRLATKSNVKPLGFLRFLRLSKERQPELHASMLCFDEDQDPGVLNYLLINGLINSMMGKFVEHNLKTG